MVTVFLQGTADSFALALQRRGKAAGRRVPGDALEAVGKGRRLTLGSSRWPGFLTGFQRRNFRPLRHLGRLIRVAQLFLEADRGG